MENQETGDIEINSELKDIIQKRITINLSLVKDITEAKKMIKYLFTYYDKTIQDYTELPEYKNIYTWLLHNKGQGLILSGDVGRGKSLIAMKVLPVLLYQKANIITRPIESYDISNKWETITKRPVIIVDDVGEEPTINEFGSRYESFSRLVDFCEKNSKILILTTNLSSDMMHLRYGIRTINRMDKLCFPVKFEGKSYR